MAYRTRCAILFCALALMTSASGCFWSEEPAPPITPHVGVDTPPNPEDEPPAPPPVDDSSGVTPAPVAGGDPDGEPSAPPSPPAPPDGPESPGPSPANDPEPAPSPGVPPAPPAPPPVPPSPPGNDEPAPLPDPVTDTEPGFPEDFDEGFGDEDESEDEDEDFPLDVRLPRADRPLVASVRPSEESARVMRYPSRLGGEISATSSTLRLDAVGCESVKEAALRYRQLVEAGDPAAHEAYSEVRGQPRAILWMDSHSVLTREKLEAILLRQAQASGLDLADVRLEEPLALRGLGYGYEFKPDSMTPLLGGEAAVMESTITALKSLGLERRGHAAVDLDAADLACDFALGRVSLWIDLTLRDGSRLRVELSASDAR